MFIWCLQSGPTANYLTGELSRSTGRKPFSVALGSGGKERVKTWVFSGDGRCGVKGGGVAMLRAVPVWDD